MRDPIPVAGLLALASGGVGAARVRLTSPGLRAAQAENRRMLRGDPTLDVEASCATLAFELP